MSCLHLSPPTYLLNTVVSTTQTLSQIKSQECIGHIQKHFITTGHMLPMAKVGFTYGLVWATTQEPQDYSPLLHHAIWWTTTYKG